MSITTLVYFQMVIYCYIAWIENKKFPKISFFRKRIYNPLYCVGIYPSSCCDMTTSKCPTLISHLVHICCMWLDNTTQYHVMNMCANSNKTSLQSLFKLDLKNEITHLLPCIIPPFHLFVIIDANACILWFQSLLRVEVVKHILIVNALLWLHNWVKDSVHLLSQLCGDITNQRRTVFPPKDTTQRLRLAMHCR